MKKMFVLVAAMALSLAACGGGSSDDAESGASNCGDVWVAGKTLAKDYEGCMLDGSEVAFTATECLDGTERVLFNSKGVFWANADGLIAAGELPDEEYSACTGN